MLKLLNVHLHSSSLLMASAFLNTNLPPGLLGMQLQSLWAKDLARQSASRVPPQSTFPPLVMKVHVLLVFWQFIWTEIKPHLSSLLRARRTRLKVFQAFIFLKLKKVHTSSYKEPGWFNAAACFARWPKSSASLESSQHGQLRTQRTSSKEKNNQIKVPAGMTAHLQTPDIAINKLFKDQLHMEIIDYIENRMEGNQRGNSVKPDCERWWPGWSSWDKITTVALSMRYEQGV